VQEADALLLAAHWSRIEDVLNQTGDVSGKVIITCSLPMNDDNTELVVAHTSSGAEELAKMIPKAQIVAAFNTVPSEVLFGVYEARRKGSRPGLLYYGDDQSGKEVAAELIRDVGFDPVDVGPLWIARYAEPFALLVAQLAYEGKDGPELAYRFERFSSPGYGIASGRFCRAKAVASIAASFSLRDCHQPDTRPSTTLCSPGTRQPVGPGGEKVAHRDFRGAVKW
jgi:8-hydroxy-5-deazaflavin:NADPH oxidoreductase